MKTFKSSGIVSGVTSLSLMALFAVAIIAGQARAGLDRATPSVERLQQTPSVVVTLGLDDIKRFEALPVIVDSLFNLPIQIEVDLKNGRLLATPKSPLAGHN